MWGLEKQQRYWLWSGSTDMRRSFDGLSGLIRGAKGGGDPLNGEAYIFLNRRSNQMKILVWESGGFLIYHKRLERGTFERPRVNEAGSVRWDELILMVEGVIMKGLKRRKRFSFPSEKRA
jgi:transposase